MTIEPTAIRCELPVNTEFGYTQIDSLAEELRKSDYQNALIFMAWEHGELDRFAQLMIGLYGGDAGQVPFWRENDYDTIFVDDHELKMVLVKAPSSFLVLRPSNRNIAQACFISRFFTNRSRKVIRVHEPVLLCYRVINDDGGTI